MPFNTLSLYFIVSYFEMSELRCYFFYVILDAFVVVHSDIVAGYALQIINTFVALVVKKTTSFTALCCNVYILILQIYI